MANPLRIQSIFHGCIPTFLCYSPARVSKNRQILENAQAAHSPSRIVRTAGGFNQDHTRCSVDLHFVAGLTVDFDLFKNYHIITTLEELAGRSRAGTGTCGKVKARLKKWEAKPAGEGIDLSRFFFVPSRGGKSSSSSR